jgi:hypothetical protein
MIQREACQIFVQELRNILMRSSDEVAKAALRRVTLFDMMYLEGSMANPGRKIVMLADGNVLYVADELQPDGRMHIMQEHRYAMLDREAMTLDYQKVSIDLREIIYEGDEWPAEVGEPTYENIKKHFIGD